MKKLGQVYRKKAWKEAKQLRRFGQRWREKKREKDETHKKAIRKKSKTRIQIILETGISEI